MSKRNYASFTGIPDENPLTAEQHDLLRQAIDQLDISLSDPSGFYRDVWQVTEWLQRFDRAEKDNTIGARLANVDRALGIRRRQAGEAVRLNAPNRFHMSMLRHLCSDSSASELLLLLRKWLLQQRPGRGTRPRPERSTAALGLARIWQLHGLGQPPSTHHSQFAQLLADIFAIAVGGAGERELHNLIYAALRYGSIEEGHGTFQLSPPPPRE